MRVARPIGISLVCFVASGCLFPAPPAAPRYFAPALAEEPRAPLGVPVRLAPVKSPVHLREPIAWRRSDVEIGFYEQRRWTELPATYVERALRREIAATGFSADDAGHAGAVVTVEVMAFEEVLAPAHEARVALAVEMRRGSCVRAWQVTARRAIAGDDPGLMARAMGESLDDVARHVGQDVRRALAHTRCAAS